MKKAEQTNVFIEIARLGYALKRSRQMTDDDFTWLFEFVEERKKFADACKACSECDVFEKCQEENRDYCEKEEGTK